MSAEAGQACPPQLLAEASRLASADRAKGLASIDALLGDYPEDARLHFVRGSLFAANGDFAPALRDMERAAAIAPDFALARFQLGLLQLTLGDGAAAQATWAPLHRLAPEDPLRVFATGLGHLIRDEFEQAADRLRQGIALNADNPPMNADMRLVLDKIEARDAQGIDETLVSPAHLLLRQYSGETRQ